MDRTRSDQRFHSQEDAEHRKALAQAFLQLSSVDEVLALLDDLCTPKEVQDMAQRLEMARLLQKGASYSEIQQATGASATTVARVSRALRYGAGGYQHVLGDE